MSNRNIARRVEALEVKSGLAGPIKEALDGFGALKNELSPLLCPVCRAQLGGTRSAYRTVRRMVILRVTCRRGDTWRLS